MGRQQRYRQLIKWSDLDNKLKIWAVGVSIAIASCVCMLLF